MNTRNKKHRRKSAAGVFLVIFLIGAAAFVVPLILQDAELNHDAAEYEELRSQMATAEPVESAAEVPIVNIDIPAEADEQPAAPVAKTPVQTQNTEGTAGSSAAEVQDVPDTPAQVSAERSTPDMTALKAQNEDFIAWIQIPGTKVDYPVVLTDDPAYYLAHTFSGKASKIGTLFSLGKTDYVTPGKNIAIYGHNIKSSGKNMFRALHDYKDMDYYAEHAVIHFDTLYHSGTYTIFAVLNMIDGVWDPSTAVFVDDAAFMNFVNRARAQAMYDTGVEVTADDEILTLITCDRGFSDPDGRMIVMAVKAS